MHDALRAAVAEACHELVALGLVSGSFGNVSGADRDAGIVAIKPSGVACGAVRPEEVALVDLASGERLDGLAPSSDTPTHLELYRAFPSLGGVAHTHSDAATAWAQACRPLPALGTTHADSFRGEVPRTRALTDEECGEGYERATGLAIVEALRALDPDEMPAVLVAGHAPFTWGESPARAVEAAGALEQAARLALATLALNPAQAPIPDALLRRHFERKHGPGAYYGQREPVT